MAQADWLSPKVSRGVNSSRGCAMMTAPQTLSRLTVTTHCNKRILYCTVLLLLTASGSSYTLADLHRYGFVHSIIDIEHL